MVISIGRKRGTQLSQSIARSSVKVALKIIGSRGIGGVSRNCIWLDGIHQDWNSPSV